MAALLNSQNGLISPPALSRIGAARLTESSQVYKKIYMAELKQLFLNRSTRDHQKANNDKRSYLFFADAIGFNAGFSERNHNLVSGCKNLTSTGNCTHSL